RRVYCCEWYAAESIVYADTGADQISGSRAIADRVAASWTGQAVAGARVDSIQDADQWTLESRVVELAPLWKYSWPDGQQVYVSDATGEVVQYTTSASRRF